VCRLVDPGVRTPLVDFFRRGEVARDVRLLAARGALAPRAHEQLALLVILVDDLDPQVRDAAAATIHLLPPGPLAAFLARSDVPDALRTFFGARGVEPAATPAADADLPLIDTTPASVNVSPEGEPPSPDADQDGVRQSVLQKLSQMDVTEKMTAAMKGSREERAILIRDPNKLVSTAVLSSPKLTESEVEAYAKNAAVSEEVTRIIGNNRGWVKNYLIAAALAKNPKTPLAMSLNLLNRLNDRDLKMLSIDRNIPEPLRLAARKKAVITDKK
jgi:hypothetical protein